MTQHTAQEQRPFINSYFSLRMIIVAGLWCVFFARLRDFSDAEGHGPGALAFVTALMLHMIAQAGTAMRWASLARPVGFEHSTRTFVRLLLEARFFSFCLASPLPGDVWRSCGTAAGGSHRMLAGCTVLADRAAGWAAVIVIALTALAHRWFSLSFGPTMLLALGLLISVLAIISIGMGVIRWCIMHLPKGHELRNATSRLIPYQARPQLIWQAVGYSFGIQLLNVMSIAVRALGMGVNVPLEAFCIAVPLVTLSAARPAHALTLQAGGVGYAWFLTSYGVPDSVAASLESSFILLSAFPACAGAILYLAGVGNLRVATSSDSIAADDARSSVRRNVTTLYQPAAFGRTEIMERVESLSVVVPLYNELRNIRPLCDALISELDAIDKPYEIIFVDDGSTDGSHAIVADLASAHAEVRVIQLRRNFGQTAALNAGIQMASGDAVVTIDADQQNDPADIALMVEKLEEGFDVVHGWRKDRHDAFISRRLPSLVANWIISKVTRFPVHDLGCTLKVMRREIAQELQLYGEMHRFIPILAHWRGARCAEVVARHHPRRFEQSKYGISRTVRVILDLITVKYMIQYFTSPMKLFGGIGLASGCVGGLAGTATLSMKLWGGIDMTGNPLLLLTVFATFVSLQFFVLGMLGELCVRTYFESQNKQPYSVRKTMNFERGMLVDDSRRETRAA